MTTLDIVSISTCLFEAILSHIFINSYTEEGKKQYTCIIAITLLAALIYTSNTFLNIGYWNVLVITFLLFTMAYFYTKKIKTSIIISVILISILMMAEMMILYAMVILLQTTVEQVTNIETYRILGMLLSKLFTLMIIKFICVKHGSKNSHAMKASYWISFFLIFVFTSLSIYLLYIYQYHSALETYNKLAVWCTCGLLYSTFLSLHMYEKVKEQAEAEQKQLMFQNQIKEQAKHVDEILITQKEIRSLRHDLKNHNIALKAYLENQDYEGALAYLQTMGKKADFTEELIETGNVTLDAILNTKRNIAQNKGIQFEIQLQIPESLFVDPIDTCIIFGNALDNAIESCDRIQNKEKRICVSILYAEDALICKVVNTYEKEEGVFLKTVKKDKLEHGFGIENIKAALSNYKSVHQFNQTDTEFTFFFKIFKT